MVISSFISSILLLALGVWSYMKLESTMNLFTERQLLIEPAKFSYKMWKDMPVTMYQSFVFFNLTNWNQVKSVGQKPRFEEVGPYVYRTVWSKSEVNFMEEEKLVSFNEKKQWIFQPHLSRGTEDDQIWTINTPLMTALALIQNAPVITRNIVSVILDGLGEGAFIKRNIRSLLFEGYSDLIVSVGPLFDRRFSAYNGKFAYLYNKNDTTDGTWTVSTGVDDLAMLNKITRFQSSIVNMTSFASGQLPQGLNEVKPECAAAWTLDQSTNGQLFAPFNRDLEMVKLKEELAKLRQQPLAGQQYQKSQPEVGAHPQVASSPPTAKRFFSRSVPQDHPRESQPQLQDSVPKASQVPATSTAAKARPEPDPASLLRDVGKYIFYPDLCRPIHLLPGQQEVVAAGGIRATRYYIDPKIFMNSSQLASNRCFEMNPRPPLANTLAATLNSVTGGNVAMSNLVTGGSSPFAIFSPPSNHHHNHNHHHAGSSDSPGAGGVFERSNHPTSFLNNALHGLGINQDHSQGLMSPAVSRLSRVRQLFSNIVSQRMSAGNPTGSLLPGLGGANHAPSLLLAGLPGASNSRHSQPDENGSTPLNRFGLNRQNQHLEMARQASSSLDGMPQSSSPVPTQSQPGLPAPPAPPPPPPPQSHSDRWITQFRFKWPRGVFSIGQCQLGAPIYASLPHFLDADEYYLEQVDGMKPNRSLHEFYIDIESTVHSIPVGSKARLQLNVATPELRFRNIPNAMIPVLWQEVTFDIDKPIATMLYFSFTLSSTLYKLLSVFLLTLGTGLMFTSLVGSFWRTKQPEAQHSNNSQLGEPRDKFVVGRRSTWPARMVGPENVSNGSCRSKSDDTLGEVRLGATGSNYRDQLSASAGRQAALIAAAAAAVAASAHGGSPKQPSSRASSQCELVSSLGTVAACSGCLLACLRHSSSTSNNTCHDHHAHHGELLAASTDSESNSVANSAR